MRQPKGKPQGFTTALSVCVMVSTNCTWKAECCSEDSPWEVGPTALQHTVPCYILQKRIKKNASIVHDPAQRLYLKLCKYRNLSIFSLKTSS